MSKRNDIALGKAIQARLTPLEEKSRPEPKVPARRVIKPCREAARPATAKGYSLAEVRPLALEVGLEISIAMRKTYLWSRKVKKQVPEGPYKVTLKPPRVKPGPEEVVTTTPPAATPLPRPAGFHEENGG